MDAGWLKKVQKVQKVYINGWWMMEESTKSTETTESTKSTHWSMMVKSTESTEWDILMKNIDTTFLQDIFMRHFDEKFWRNILIAFENFNDLYWPLIWW